MSDAAQLPVTVVQCPACGKLDPGPREVCTSCRQAGLKAHTVPGNGKLVSWTMIRRPPTAFREEGEYAVAVVALAAGVQVTGRLQLDGSEPSPGIPVTAIAENNGVTVFAAACQSN